MIHKRNYARFWAVWRARKATGKTYRELREDFGYASHQRPREMVAQCDRQLAFALTQGWEMPCASFVRDGTLGVTFTFTLGEEGYDVSLDEGEE